MVSQGDDIHPVLHELACQAGNDSLATRCVLAIYHNGIHPVLLTKFGYGAVKGAAAGLAHNISQKKDDHQLWALEPQGTTVTGILEARTSFSAVLPSRMEVSREW